MNNPIDKIQYKIDKYNSKYTDATNLESKLIYSIKLYNYVKQLGGNEFEDKVKQLDSKLDSINADLDNSNQIYNTVRQLDNSLLSIAKIVPYNKESNELVTYYRDTTSNIKGFSV